MSRNFSKTTDATEVWIQREEQVLDTTLWSTDFTGLDYMLNNIDAHIVFDVTHSVPKPVVPGGTSSGGKLFTWQDWHDRAALESKTSQKCVDPDIMHLVMDPNMVHLDKFEELVDDILIPFYKRQIR